MDVQTSAVVIYTSELVRRLGQRRLLGRMGGAQCRVVADFFRPLSASELPVAVDDVGVGIVQRCLARCGVDTT